MPNLTRRRVTALLWLVGIAVYVVAIAYIGWRPIADALATARPVAVFLMAAVIFAALWIRVLKWRVALGPHTDAAALFWLSKAAGEWSPGRIGELSPLVLRRYRTPRVAAWIIVDRILEMVTTIALGVAGIALIRTPNRAAMLLSAFVIVAALALTLTLLMQGSLFQRAHGRFAEKTLPGRFFRFAEGVGVEVYNFRNVLPAAVALTIIPGIMDVISGVVLYQAFDTAVSFPLMAAVKGLHAVTSAVPLTPNATGVPYLTAAILLHEIGGVPSGTLAAAITLAVAITNVTFWLSALVAAPYLRKRA